MSQWSGLEGALRSMRALASVSTEGDPWYAENSGLDADAIFLQARKALREEEQPADGGSAVVCPSCGKPGHYHRDRVDGLLARGLIRPDTLAQDTGTRCDCPKCAKEATTDA